MEIIKYKTQEELDYYIDFYSEDSMYDEMVFVPEQYTTFYDDYFFKVQSDKEFYILIDKQLLRYNSNIDRRKDFDNIKTPEELMDFLNKNICYGWLDNNDEAHYSTLKTFKQKYKTCDIEKMLKYGVGTCIEQANMINYVLNKLGFETKMYCFRRYENDEALDKDVYMHCFVIFNYNDKWYHFEHSNRSKRGIHEYPDVDSAIHGIVDNHPDSKNRCITEIDSIPNGVSFMEFNQHVNTFDEQSLHI